MATKTTKPISRCPKCKALLQATLKVDLSRVAVHEGQIVSFRVDGIDDDSHDQIERLIDQAGTFGSELRVYCENDHDFDIDGDDAPEAKRNPCMKSGCKNERALGSRYCAGCKQARAGK
jgi:hypothetical protein